MLCISISKFYGKGGTGLSWSENCIFPYDEVNTHILVFFFALSNYMYYNHLPDLFYSFSFEK